MQARPPGIYTTPALIRQQLRSAPTGTSQSVEDKFNDDWALIMRYCRDYSVMIETKTNRTFVPYAATKNKYFAEEIRNGRFLFQRDTGRYVLDLWEDLLTVSGITWDETVLTDSEYRLVGENSSGDEYPYSRILFDGDSVPSYDLDFDTKIAIVGEWGVHDNSTSAYSDVTTLAAAMLDTTGTTITLADDGALLFEVYQYIRIDDELMLITGLDNTTAPADDTLTVERGANGFTAAPHVNGATIEAWNVVGDIQELGTRMGAYWYGKRADVGELIQMIDRKLLIARFSEELSGITRRRQRSLMGVS